MSSEFSNTQADIALTKKLDGFSDLLNSIQSLDDKTRILWKDIYHNAFNDRMMAQSLFDNLWPLVQGKPEHHAVHGQTLAKYIERMTRSNDQLIKLADLVEKAKDKEEAIDTSAVYQQLSKIKEES